MTSKKGVEDSYSIYCCFNSWTKFSFNQKRIVKRIGLFARFISCKILSFIIGKSTEDINEEFFIEFGFINNWKRISLFKK